MYGLKFNFLVFKISVGQRFFLVLLLVILILVIIVFILDFVGIEILVLVFITLTLHFRIRRLIVSFRVFYRLCFFVLLGHFFLGLVLLCVQTSIFFRVVKLVHVRIHVHSLGI